MDEMGQQTEGMVIHTNPLFAEVGSVGGTERVSTGTKFALKLWLESMWNKSK